MTVPQVRAFDLDALRPFFYRSSTALTIFLLGLATWTAISFRPNFLTDSTLNDAKPPWSNA